MSVYKSKKSPYYRFDFKIGGHRFHGSTKRRTQREAEAVERDERERAQKQVADMRDVSTSLQIDDVAGRYWVEVGQHHTNADNTKRDLARLVEHFGTQKLITEITGDDVAKLVAWRRGHRVIRSRKVKANAKDAPFITPATVNRTTTEVLKKLFTRAKTWGVAFRQEPRWKDHMLDEPEERVRELIGDEGERLNEATRDDYAPLLAYAHTTGVRKAETLLLWSEVDWGERLITTTGKGGKSIRVAITPAIRALLWPLRGHHPDSVFTYIAARTIDKVIRGKRYRFVKGERYPITLSGLNSQWKRTRKAAGVSGFRFHDYRHDFASKLMRQEKNPKLVQRALHHADIKTTMRYMHLLDDDVGNAMERLAKSRTKSRTANRKVG